MLEVEPKLCGQCGGCVAVCARGALELFVSGLLIKPELCTCCQNCIAFCPVGALRMKGSKGQAEEAHSKCSAKAKVPGQNNSNQR